MYLLEAPEKLFGVMPAGTAPVCDHVKFYSNVGFCTSQFWKKAHTDLGFVDITPPILVKKRERRTLSSVLLRATGGIGDSLWVTPVAKQIKKLHPRAVVAVAVTPELAPLWKLCPWCDSVLNFGSWQHLGFESRASEIYDFGGIATVYPDLMALEPVSACMAVAGLKLPSARADMRPDIRLPHSAGVSAGEVLKKHNIDVSKDRIVAICVEASTANRCWPYSFCIDLAKRLAAEGSRVVLLGKSLEYADSLIDEKLGEIGVANLLGKTSIVGAWAIMAMCDCVVAPNSSPLVVASALSVPCVGLFGSHDPRRIGKYYDRFIGISANLSCSPCNEHWTECRLGHPAPCMRSISVDSVISAVFKLFKLHPVIKRSVLPV